MKLIKWYEREILKSSVIVHLNTEINDYKKVQADEIIIATGAIPKDNKFKGNGKKICAANTSMLRDELLLHNVDIYTDAEIVEVNIDNIIICQKNKTQKLACDMVISAIGYKPGTGLAKKEESHVHFIGDVKTVGNIKSAIYAANKLAIKIG